MKRSGELQTLSYISYKIESVMEVPIKEKLGEALEAVILNFDGDGIEECDYFMATLIDQSQ